MVKTLRLIPSAKHFLMAPISHSKDNNLLYKACFVFCIHVRDPWFLLLYMHGFTVFPLSRDKTTPIGFILPFYGQEHSLLDLSPFFRNEKILATMIPLL